MKIYNFIFLFTIIVLAACDKDEDVIPSGEASVEIKFDNIAIVDGVQRQLTMVSSGDTTNYDYSNAMDQPFNITLLKYYISKIVLEGPDGAYFEDEMLASATESKGYYLIDESVEASQLIDLENVPYGKYNKITFTIGVDESGVSEGAAAGSLDPATSEMFWNWNSGYVAMKMEGHSPVSAGGASGNTVDPSIAKGMAYHVGGWKDIDGSAFVNNVRRLSYDFDTDLSVTGEGHPNVHMVFDVISLFGGENLIDFTGNNNVHKPSDGIPFANNYADAFAFDHIHQ